MRRLIDKAMRFVRPVSPCGRGSANAPTSRHLRQSGNVFFAVFAAVAMVGAVGYGFNTVLRGPISGMTEVTRRTVAESTVITASRLAIVGATTYQANGGNCDTDPFIEPLPFYNAGSNPKPANGGWLPRGSGPPAWKLMPDTLDPWKTEYGYCAWDSGAVRGDAACGGYTGRLQGSTSKNAHSFVIISAGKNRVFETSCQAFDGATPNAPLFIKPNGSDDIVLPYTYAEANDLGNGLWNTKTATPTTLTTDKNLEVTGGGKFAEPVVLTAGGLVLPGDPGDDSLTGACSAANDKQLRRNIADPANPVLEICDFSGSMGWSPISGGAGGGSGGSGNDPSSLTGTKVTHWKLDETSGTTAFDSWGSSNGTLVNAPTWQPSGGNNGGALSFNGVNQKVRVAGNPYITPTAVSISLWMKRNGAQASNAILVSKLFNNQSPPEYVSYEISFSGNDDDRLHFMTGHTGGTNELMSTSAIIPDNQWINVVAVYDPNAAAPQKRIYINGALNASSTLTTPMVSDTATPSGDLLFGDSNPNGGQPYKGLIDDVRIYNYALPIGEINSIYKAGAPIISNQRPIKSGAGMSWGSNSFSLLGNAAATGAVTSPVAMANANDLIQLAPSTRFACALKSDGKVYCWGDDTNGRLGNGATTAAQSTMGLVSGLSDMTQVATGENHACAVKADGTAWCWGLNTDGQLGNGSNTASDVPVKVSNISDFVYVAAGISSSCGVRAGGEAWCWGNGSSGTLGNGANSASNVPVKVSTVTDFARISMSKQTNASVCAVTKSGKSYCWGGSVSVGNGTATSTYNTPQLTSTTMVDFVDVQVYYTLTCGLRATGEIYCWGRSFDGQLGNGGATGDPTTSPAKVSFFSDFTKMSIGRSPCALRANGEAYCWGLNTSGYLGTGSVAASLNVPTRVQGGNFIDIGYGGSNGYAIVSSAPRKTALVIPRDRGLISAGSRNGCAINRTDGTAWCWGNDGQEQIGNGAATGDRESPAIVSNPGPWTQITMSGDWGINNHACAIKDNGNLYCWGHDGHGELGNGSTTGNQDSPILVGLATDQWSSVSVDGETSCAIKSNGTLWCWGWGSVTGTNMSSGDRTSPTQVGTGLWKSVTMGRDNACAVDISGDAWCWGDDANGKLGNGPTDPSDGLTPSKVASPGPWAMIAPGNATCGVKLDGSLWCWGDPAAHGLSGDNTAPIRVPEPGPWVYVASGAGDPGHTPICAIKADGTLWCWGENSQGQLGRGTTTDSMVPMQVSGGGNWTSVDVGNASPYSTSFVCGMKADNSAWCWGHDQNGQLGNGAALTADQTVPSRVDLPKSPAFTWNPNNISYSPSLGASPALGNTRYISNDGAAGTGLRVASTGRANLTQPSSGNQLLIEGAEVGYNAQVSLSAIGALGPSPDVTTGLISRWRLDESSGTSALDIVGGYNGTLSNSPTWQPSGGKLNGALSFTATSDQQVIVPRNSAHEVSAVTMSVWIKRNGAQQQWAGVLQKDWNGNGSPTYFSYGLMFNDNSDSQIAFSVGYSGGQYSIVSGASAIPNNVWKHVVASYDRTRSSQQLRLYIDGVLVATGTGTAAIDYGIYEDGSLTIGGTHNEYGPEAYTGLIDEARVYGRQLSDAEVLALYNSYSPGTVVTARAFGLDYAAGNFVFARNTSGTDQPLSSLTSDIEIDPSGNVGIGTTGQPMAKLDVNGAIKIGTGASCSASAAGTIDYNSGTWRYCNSSGSWAPFGTTPSVPWTSVSVGEASNCGQRANGLAYCWGTALYGRLGNNTSSPDVATPSAVHSDSSSTGWNDWKMISAGYAACGIRTAGTMWCWGYATNGSLGNGTTTPNRTRPVQVRDNSGSATYWSDWKFVTTHDYGYVTCGIRAGGTAWCWGYASYGRLGNGTTTPDRNIPSQVRDNSGSATYWSDWKLMSAGNTSVCGIRTNGTAWCWGEALNGKLGNGTTTPDRNIPSQVLDDTAGATFWSDWTSISVGAQHACGIRTNGTAWCWGAAANGRLGNNDTTTNKSRPSAVLTSSGSGSWADWKSVSAGYQHSCGIRRDGSAWCWGQGQGGRLGYGNATTNSDPIQVRDSTGASFWTDWVAVEAGEGHSCGVRANGTAWCWGQASGGALGDGQMTPNKLLPVQVN